MIWSEEFLEITSDITFNTVWILLMLMTKLSINQIKKEFNILSLQENGKLTFSMIWGKFLSYSSQLGVETPDYITRVTEYIP